MAQTVSTSVAHRTQSIGSLDPIGGGVVVEKVKTAGVNVILPKRVGMIRSMSTQTWQMTPQVRLVRSFYFTIGIRAQYHSARSPGFKCQHRGDVVIDKFQLLRNILSP
jgi:hypothetical protein